MTVSTNVNYTPEMEARMQEVYQPDAEQDVRTQQVADLAAEFGRSTRSVIAKLTTMQLYVPKVYKTKQGKAVVKKETLVSQLENLAGVELSGIEKATKKTLETLVSMAAELKQFKESEEI